MAVKDFFRQWVGADQVHAEPVCVRHASAALMAEVMAADHDWDEIEQQRIIQLLQQQFELGADEAERLVLEVMAEQKNRTDLFQFTSVINSSYGETEKYELIKNLWHVAYADGTLDAHEEHMIRRVSNLLHLPHRLFIRAKIEIRDARLSAT